MWQTIVWTVLKGIGVYVRGEVQTAIGRIDMTVETPTRVFILETGYADKSTNINRLCAAS